MERASANRSPICATRWKTSVAVAQRDRGRTEAWLAAVTIDAVDRSGRSPNGQLVPTFPRSDVVSQVFGSDVGVDNDPIRSTTAMSGTTFSASRRHANGPDEVKDQVEARWRDDQIASRLRAKATEMVQNLEQGGKSRTRRPMPA